MAAKKLSLNIMPEEIIGAEIVRSNDYRHASVGIKRGEDEYMRIMYEWKGEKIPEFVMSLMGWMQANREEIDARKEEFKDEYKSLKERI